MKLTQVFELVAGVGILFTVVTARADLASEFGPQIVESFKGSGSLKSFEVEVQEEKVIFEDGQFVVGPNMVARYRTDSQASLRDYVIVQFIRGCIFGSERGADGKVEKILNVGRDHYGKSILFKHPERVVDQLENDPAYWSFPAESKDRHYYYRWNSVTGSTDEKTQKILGKAVPPQPEVYVTDSPNGASSGPVKGERIVTNVSLEFETCIYRTSDVPRNTPASGEGMGKSLHCVKWKSAHVFNHETEVFESPEAIDPFCLSR